MTTAINTNYNNGFVISYFLHFKKSTIRYEFEHVGLLHLPARMTQITPNAFISNCKSQLANLEDWPGSCNAAAVT